MALYLIAFNDEWVQEHTLEELREKAASARALIDEMTEAGVIEKHGRTLVIPEVEKLRRLIVEPTEE